MRPTATPPENPTPGATGSWSRSRLAFPAHWETVTCLVSRLRGIACRSCMKGGDLADEDDGSLIGHSVQNVFDAVRCSGLRGGEWGCQQCRKKRLRDDFNHPVHGLSAALSTAGALKCSDGLF